MTTTLPNGTRVPDVASTSWAGDLEVNWQLLDAAIGAIGSNVKTNRPNTWTAEQTFSEPIVGNLTGTASKAGADEDGTSIKTGYVNVAGNQTVSGQKTWSGNQTYNGMMILQASSNVVEQFRQKLPKDVSTSTDALARFNTLVDSAGHNVVVTTEGHWETYVSKSVTLKYKNDSTKAGTVDFRLGSNGKGILYPQSPFECSLGNSANQWSSVYAQTYYYNGVAWGLDKTNVWTGSNTFNSNIKEQLNYTIGETPATTTGKAIQFVSSSGADLINVTGAVYSTGANIVIITAGDRFTENRVKSPTGTIRQCNLQIGTRANGDRFLYTDGTWRSSLLPYIEYGSTSPDSMLNLGTSTNKWKTLNGVNPGALSLPNGNAQDTSWIGDLTIKDGSDYNLKTFSLNGWITINIPNTAGNLVVVNNGCGQIITNEAKGITGSNCSVFIPVVANVQVSILLVLQTGESVKTAIFTPCLGNV